MRRDEKGFTQVELLIAITIVALIAGAALMSTFQVLNVTRSSNDHMTAIRQVQNAGYWISRDALMAENAVGGDDPGTPETEEFLFLTWTEWSYEEDEASIYHSVTYYFQDLPGVSGKLKRIHSSSAGADEETLIAKYINYDPEKTWAIYQTPVLRVQVAAAFGEASETREYTVWRRPEF